MTCNHPQCLQAQTGCQLQGQGLQEFQGRRAAFTDDDLKRLKDRLASGPGEVVMLTESADDLAALIARLEAAEKCVELCATDENCCNIPELGENDISPYYLWRKAAGK